MYRQISPSATLLLNEQSASIANSGQEVFRFGFGQSPFPVCEVLENALKENAYRKEYTEVQGLESLREKVAEFHQRFEQRLVSADRVFIAPGSKALLYSIMCAYTDAVVLIPAPAWVSYAPQAQLLGHKTLFMPTCFEDRYRLTPEILEKSLATVVNKHKTLLVILNTPGNPDGLSYTDAELQALATVLKKYSAMVISDEIYGPLHHEGQHVSIAKHYPQATFVTSGLSKWAGAGGWRLGIAILPQDYDPQLKASMLGIASETYSCASAPIQHAAIVAYAGNPLLEKYVINERSILKGIGQLIHQQVIEAGLRAHMPEGGFYLLVDFSLYRQQLAGIGIAKDSDICAKILHETGVALLPGISFGLPPQALAARMAYVDFDGESALKDIALQAWSDQLSQKYAEKMCRGIKKLGAFLKSLPD
ncbi:MAG: aspartate aminotransferase [Paraglaciecola sp.]|jgi:aspartate aminotransferase